jgi:ribonuclease Z
MFELVFLGTAASRPTAERGLPALMVLHETERFLIDCGEGTQRQLMRAGLGFRRLKRVFLTHDHLDHVLALGGLIASLAEAPERRALTIYASAATRALAERFLGEVVLPETDAHLDVHFETLHADAAVATDSVIVRGAGQTSGRRSFGLFEGRASRAARRSPGASANTRADSGRGAKRCGSPIAGPSPRRCSRRIRAQAPGG